MPRLAPFGVFPTADAWVALRGPTDAFAHGVFRAMDRPDLADDKGFCTRDARVAQADELHRLVSEWTSARPAVEMLGALERHGVLAAQVRHPAEAVRDPLVRERAEVVPLAHPVHGAAAEVSGTGVPIRFSGSDVRLDRPPPALGEHNQYVYGELLGYSADEIDKLTADAVI